MLPLLNQHTDRSFLTDAKQQLTGTGMLATMAPGLPRPLTGGRSVDEISLLPICAWANNRNFFDFLHIEKIAVDTDQQCTCAGNGRT